MDRNDYYGGESTSLNLNQVLLSQLFFYRFCGGFISSYFYYTGDFCLFHLQLWKKFRGEEKAPEHLGASRDYNVDMMPKVLFLVPFIFFRAD